LSPLQNALDPAEAYRTAGVVVPVYPGICAAVSVAAAFKLFLALVSLSPQLSPTCTNAGSYTCTLSAPLDPAGTSIP
jgi:hypothetical protein